MLECCVSCLRSQKLHTSIQSGGTFPHYGFSIPGGSAPPQVEAVVAMAIQALQGEVADCGVIDFHHLHWAVVILHD